jgi:hypothetical protein
MVPLGALAGGHFQAEKGKMQMAIPFLLRISSGGCAFAPAHYNRDALRP